MTALWIRRHRGQEPDVAHLRVAVFGHQHLLGIACDHQGFQHQLPTRAQQFAQFAQMIAQIACTGREWVDFVSYDPRIKDPKRQIFIRRFTPTADEVAKVEDAARQFLAEVDQLFALISAEAA